MNVVHNIFADLGVAVGSHYCDVDVETRRDGEGNYHATYIATMRPYLRAALKVEMKQLGIVAGADPVAWIKLLTDEKLRPFQARLERASVAAAEAWEKALAEEAPATA